MKNSIIVGIVAVCVVVGVGLAFVFIKIPSIAETTTGYGTTSEQQTTTTGGWTTTTETQPPKPPTETQTPTPPSVEMAKLSITVHAPSNSPSGEAVYMLVGELYFESTREFSMTKISANTWRLVLEAPVGSVLRYRYSREMSWDKEESYVYRDGIGFHYREIVVKEDMELEESIAKWEDLPLLPNSVGDLIGKVTDSAGLPVMGLMVSAGPQQTFTDFNGNYRIYGVPAGPCPVSVRALNGEYYSQIARIDIRAGETTTHNFTVTSAPMRKVIFEVAVPHDHPDGAVPRILGDTYHLGFYTTFGGTAIHVSRVIDMEPDPEEERYWTYTTTISEGTYVRYYYTLGDHKINRERDKNGNYVLRGLFVKGETTVDDDVWSWKAGNQVPLTLEVKSPTDDTVYFTTDEWGGYEPIRMWPKGGNVWYYVYYVDPGVIIYRYLRNGDSDIGVEQLSPDTSEAYRRVNVGSGGLTQRDTITRWRHQVHETLPASISLHKEVSVQPRVSGEPFHTGIELIDYWRPSWLALVPSTAGRISDHGAAWVQLPSVVGIISTDPPIIDARWNSFNMEELVYTIRALHQSGLKVAMRAFPYPSDLPYEGFERHNTNEWYDKFFAEVQSVYLSHAKIAEQEGVELLILANFPFYDADTATAPYINQKWKGLIAEIRKIYSGPITIDFFIDTPAYDWYGELDYIGDKWWESIAETSNDSYLSMKLRALQILQTKYLPIYQRFNKPIIFAEIAYYSADSSAKQKYGVYSEEISDFLPEDPTVASDWQEQADAYEAVYQAFAETPWVQGAYSFGYSFMDHDSKGYSIRAKTAEKVVKLLYIQFNASG